MEKLFLPFNNSQFNIFNCRKAAVGDKKRHPDVLHNWFSSPEQPFEEHYLHRIYCVTKGEATFWQYGKKHTLKEGYTYFIPESSVQASICEDYMVQYYIHFSQVSFFPNITDLYEFYPCIRTNGLIPELFETIGESYKSNNPSDLVRCSGAMLLLLSFFIKEPKISFRKVETLLPVLNYIDDHYTENISVGTLATIMNYSPLYFENLFKEVLKIPPLQFIIRKRILFAQNLLISECMSIKEIAAKCGYNDPLYFSKIFKKQTGFSPKEYRLKR